MGGAMVGTTPREQFNNLKLDCLLGLMGKTVPSPDGVQLALQPVVAAYSENVRRLQHYVNLPAFAVAFALRFEHHRCLAIQEVKGSLVPVEHSDTDRSVINDKFNKIFNESNRELNKRIAQTGGDRPSPIVIQELSDGLHILSQLAATGVTAMLSAASEMLASHVTATWTIFETLAGDLWEAAVNGHPANLAKLKGKKNRIRGAMRSSVQGVPIPDDRGNGEGKSIPLSQVERYKYNISDKMGTILSEKFKFDRLDGIREAYSLAFCNAADEVDAALTDRALDALSQTRNLIVHRAGLVDRRYYDQTKKLPLALKGEIGAPILLDGEVIKALVEAGIDRCNHLIVAVDDWLGKH
jgi:hypothetical protein